MEKHLRAFAELGHHGVADGVLVRVVFGAHDEVVAVGVPPAQLAVARVRAVVSRPPRALQHAVVALQPRGQLPVDVVHVGLLLGLHAARHHVVPLVVLLHPAPIETLSVIISLVIVVQSIGVLDDKLVHGEAPRFVTRHPPYDHTVVCKQYQV